MRTIWLLKNLERYPLFTENDIAKLVNKSPMYVRTMLYRLNKGRLIKRIEKGKYTLYDDAMIFASNIITPSYLSLWTALRHYNMTQQQPYGIFVISPVSKKPIRFQNTEIIFKKSGRIFGYKKERYADFDLFIADREKAIIDSLLFKLPLQDIAEALASNDLDFKKLAEYAKLTGNLSLIKRLGYILENAKGSAYGLKPMDNNYVALDYLGKMKGKKDARWKLIINYNANEKGA